MTPAQLVMDLEESLISCSHTNIPAGMVAGYHVRIYGVHKRHTTW